MFPYLSIFIAPTRGNQPFLFMFTLWPRFLITVVENVFAQQRSSCINNTLTLMWGFTTPPGTESEVYIEVEIDIDWRPLGRSWTFAGRSWSSLGGILAGASGQNAA